MGRAKGKSQLGGSALAKAIRTGQVRNTAPTNPRELNTTCLDFKTAAAVSEFTVEDRGLDAAKKASTKSGVKTVFAGESWINVEHRIRAAAVPLGQALKDEAFIAEDLTVEGVTAVPKALVRRLMPRRPPWSFDVSSGRLHFRETQAFKQWLEDIRLLISERGGYPPAFEQNLQVWRQLWRVLERCDVVALVVDSRHPLLHLPPALVYHVAVTLKKPLVLVLNKLDTISPSEALQWARCLREGVPGVDGVTAFSKEALRAEDYGGLGIGREALIDECHRVHGLAQASRPSKEGAAARGGEGETPEVERRPESGRVMIGLVGHPNVGKSSMVNNLMGGKVVSVKATPGHTKTLQTLVLDERTCLCDSPGVVFPRLEVPREAQIVGMLIPIAQVREPFSALRWVMEHARKPLQDSLGLKKPALRQVIEWKEAGIEALNLDDLEEEDGDDLPWSPMLLCVQYAAQRGLLKSGGPDTLRAGMEILERVLDERLPYAVQPPQSWKRPDSAWTAVEKDPDFSEESDYQIDDDEFESEPENTLAADLVAKGDLLGYFGEERQAPGSNSIKSKKRQAKVKQKLNAEAD